MEIARVFQVRQQLRRTISDFFLNSQYLEVETPLLVNLPGTEVHLTYFESSWQDYHARTFPKFLRSSPELHMKRVLSRCQQPIFQLGPCFRNKGELSAWHHPEFTMLEWYDPRLAYTEFMQQCEALIRHCYASFGVAAPATFTRISVAEAFRRFANLELRDQDPNLAKHAKAQGIYSVNAHDDFETAFFKVLLERIEPALTQREAVILYDYPPSQAALARLENGWAKRFEFYLHGVEILNAFAELTDLSENRSRIVEASQQRVQLGTSPLPLDEDFLTDIASLPNCCGAALGFERLLACILSLNGIAELLPFRGDYLRSSPAQG